MAEPTRMLHVLPSPFYGESENAFNTVNKTYLGVSHTVVLPPRSWWHLDLPGHTWIAAVSELQTRADEVIVAPEDGKLSIEPTDVFCAVVYDVTEELVEKLFDFELADVPTVLWQMWRPETCDRSISVFGDRSRYVKDRKSFVQLCADATWSHSDAACLPMLDVGRLSAMAAKSSRFTVGLFFDPVLADGSGQSSSIMLSMLKPFVDRLSSGEALPAGSMRVVVPDCDAARRLVQGSSTDRSGIAMVGDMELVIKPYRIGFDWMYGSVCDLVAYFPSKSRNEFGFLGASAMAMGKPTSFYRAEIGVRERTGCLPACVSESRKNVSHMEFSCTAELCRQIRWVHDNPDKARLLSAAAQFHSFRFDKDCNLGIFREAVDAARTGLGGVWSKDWAFSRRIA